MYKFIIDPVFFFFFFFFFFLRQMTRSIQPTMKSERERESRTERETLSQYVCVDVFFMIRALIRTQ